MVVGLTEAERKAAKAAYDREYRAKNAKRLQLRRDAYRLSGGKQKADAKYREAHKTEAAAYKKVWHANNAARISAERAVKHAADPSIRQAESRRSYVKHAETIKARAAAWLKANPSRKKASDASYYVANSEALRAKSIEWRMANPERKAANDKAWAQNNPLKVRLNTARRHKRVRQATPGWASRQDLDDVYLEAKHMQMCVDHIIPLKHKLVCGLHVVDNLQLLTRSANAKKSNKFDPETCHAY